MFPSLSVRENLEVGAEGLIPAKVTVVESLGHERHLICRLEDGQMVIVRQTSEERPETPDDVSMAALVPAFVLSELKTAFLIGFVVFVPFLVIDLIVSSSLMSLGMMMMPPVMVSLPFKLLLFVMVDGWALIVRALLSSYAPS